MHQDSLQLQQVFFQQIKNQLPTHLALVDEVVSVLDISHDSAYRRIRGEKMLSFEEIQQLSQHFKISIDQILHLKSDAFIFTGRITNNTDFTFDKWLQSVIEAVSFITSHKPCHLFYLVKEIPFYYYFLNKEMAAFKSFFFMKSILYYEDWKNAKFSVKDDYSQYHAYYKKISECYANVPSTEIWSIENITSTMHQIEFYRITGSLKSDEDALILFEKLEEIINHIELQAEQGIKLHAGQKQNAAGPQYKMFSNELIMGDNMQQAFIGDSYITFMNHSVINFILTKDKAFNDYTKKMLDNIAQKSTPISEVNEKERLLFFNRLRTKIYNAKKNVAANPVYT